MTIEEEDQDTEEMEVPIDIEMIGVVVTIEETRTRARVVIAAGMTIEVLESKLLTMFLIFWIQLPQDWKEPPER